MLGLIELRIKAGAIDALSCEICCGSHLFVRGLEICFLLTSNGFIGEKSLGSHFSLNYPFSAGFLEVCAG